VRHLRLHENDNQSYSQAYLGAPCMLMTVCAYKSDDRISAVTRVRQYMRKCRETNHFATLLLTCSYNIIPIVIFYSLYARDMKERRWKGLTRGTDAPMTLMMRREAFLASFCRAPKFKNRFTRQPAHRLETLSINVAEYIQCLKLCENASRSFPSKKHEPTPAV